MNTNFKKWALSLMALLLAALVLLGTVTVIIDPFFHYHAPLDGLQYSIFYERYQNDGIVKHFDYDALITGNSMCENFKTSEMDALFGTNAIKVPFSGATEKELDTLNRTAIEYNDDIRMILMDVDYQHLIIEKDALTYDESDYPTFLYDNNPFNDVKYLFNKSIFKYSLEVLTYTLAGNTTTSFDDYAFWDTPDVPYGRDIVLMTYRRAEPSDVVYTLTDEQAALVRANIEQNVLETARANPQIEFYIFIPPFSMYYWDRLDRAGEMEMQLAAEREAVALLLTCDNIHLYSFTDAFDLVQDMDQYKDYIHYNSKVNSWMLECMAAGEHRITRDNCEAYFTRVHDFYTGFDYDTLFPEGYED